jgi:hypothetical protein
MWFISALGCYTHLSPVRATADSYFDSVETASENLSWNSAFGRT